MHSKTHLNGVVAAVLGAALLLGVPGSALAQGVRKGSARGFRLLARAGAHLIVNRVQCGIISTGELCVDADNSTTIGGGFWPKNSPQQYLFNSGMQVAGYIENTGGWGWSGDTTGAFFFDPKGTTRHGEQVEPIWNYSDSTDRTHWPQAAYVPLGDPSAALYDISLRGRPTASEGDMWTLAWDGDPALNAGRPHPLGVAMETRVLAWNYPAGNSDIIYFVHTFYNISSTCAADYAAIRPGLREELLALGVKFKSLNEAKFGVTIPACGYTLKKLYFANANDADVSSNAGNNYSSVNIPLAMGYTYQDAFQRPDGGYRLPADIGAPPFIDGYGFVGIKFLRTPIVTGQEAGIVLFSVPIFGDAQNSSQLYRHLRGAINPALGDANCNFNQTIDHICYVKSDGHADMRSWQSTGPADLAPGGSVSIVTAYLFASAVASPGCPAANCGSVLPGDPRRLSDATFLASQGANLIDSLTGFRGYVDDNADGKVQGSEFRAVRGSLINKAQLAQLIFDRGFLVPQAPVAPDFFLVPGSDQVTVIWRSSPTEGTGDNYFTSASDPTSPSYDPNYRQFDVEGYRIYRGRLDDPTRLSLLVQFDYGPRDAQGHQLLFSDYLGVVDPGGPCAPELGSNTIAQGCPIDFDAPPAPGVAYVAHLDHPIVSPFIQVKLGDRIPVVGRDPFIVTADTAVIGGASGRPDLQETGVPFIYVDHTAKNNLKYFYVVTAFDINSLQSGPSSLESTRLIKGVTPVAPASNYHADATVIRGVQGRGGVKDPNAPMPVLDSITGEFNGPMPVADGASLDLLGDFAAQVVNGSGGFSARLDSLRLGQVELVYCCGAGGIGVPAHYYYTVSDGTSTTQVDIPLLQDLSNEQTAATTFDAIPLDQTAANRYGGDNGYTLRAMLTLSLQQIGYAGGAGLGGALGGLFGYYYPASYRYNGFRWFSGSNETKPDPTSAGACGSGISACALTSLPDYNNAGTVTAAGAPVGLVYMPHSYLNINREWRNVEAVLGGAVRAADIRVYWGGGGVVDSVIDLTHDVPLSWDSTRLGAGWAILNTADQGTGSQDGRPTVLTPADWECVEPLFSQIPGAQGFFPCTTQRSVAKTAILGATAVGVGDNQSTVNAGSWRTTTNNNGGSGFSMYVAGTITFFGGMSSLPAAGDKWTLRSYSGAIFGGKGGAPGSLGPYRFTSRPRPLTAVGASLVYDYTVAQRITPPTRGDLSLVHTVPDPYYVANGYETDPAHKVIKFVNLPNQAIIRIYTTSGVLVRVLEHNSGVLGGAEDWDVRNSGGSLVANGVYFYAIEANDARRVGRMTIVLLSR